MGSQVKTKKEQSARGYFDSLPLYEWYEEFSTSYNKNGTLKYTTVWQFVQKKAKTKSQQNILWWALGPLAVDGQSKYPNIPQMDWMEKRNKGFWFGNDLVKKIAQDVNKQMSSLEAVREAGKINVDVIGNLSGMLSRLDQEMGGQLFLSHLSAKENEARLNFLLTIKERVVHLLTTLQTMYAKSQGIDFANLEAMLTQFGTLLAPQVIGKTLDAGMHKQESETASQLTHLLMNKSVEYHEEGITLPDKQMEDVVLAIGKKGKGRPN